MTREPIFSKAAHERAAAVHARLERLLGDRTGPYPKALPSTRPR